MARRNEENQTRKIVGYFVEKLAGEMEGSAARRCACYGFLVDNSSSRCVCAGK
jgi:nucleoside phosphorylase